MSSRLSWVERRVLGTALALLVLTTGAAAQHVLPWRSVFWSDDFSTPRSADYIIGRSTVRDSLEGCMMLTAKAPAEAGRLFPLRGLTLDFFEVSLRARFGGRESGNTGADGIVIAFCPLAVYPESTGGQLNVDGCGGYGFEMDTYENSLNADPSEEHFALIRETTANHLHAETTPAGTMKDNGWHAVRFTCDNGVTTGWFDGQARFNHTISGYTAIDGFIGFTSATGTSYNRHDIDDVRITTPTRRRSQLGRINLCDASPFDTVLAMRNNRLTEAVELRSIQLTEPDGTDEFQLIPPALPLLLNAGTDATARLLFTGTREGIRRAIVVARAATGETVIDTLILEALLPHAAWTTAPLDAPAIHAGTTVDVRTELVNTGEFPITLDRIAISSPRFTLVSPATLPMTLAPGERREFVFRFTPDSVGAVTATVSFPGTCGAPADLLLRGSAFQETVRLAFTVPPLMLTPGTPGHAVLLLRDGPVKSTVRGVTASLTYDVRVARFTGADSIGTVLPAGGTVRASETIPGRITLTIDTPTPLAGPGPLCRLAFTPMTRDTGCTAILFEDAALNVNAPVPGTPMLLTEGSTICVNPSCRVADGIIRTSDLARLALAPNPAGGAVSITASLPEEAWMRITIINAAGRCVATVAEGRGARGVTVLHTDLSRLPSGSYTALLETGGRTIHHPFIITR